jgi:hypothetical protein
MSSVLGDRRGESFYMKPETQAWIDKAEGDWKVAQREMQATDGVM